MISILDGAGSDSDEQVVKLFIGQISDSLSSKIENIICSAVIAGENWELRTVVFLKRLHHRFHTVLYELLWFLILRL